MKWNEPSELARAKEIERKGIERFGEAWRPSKWHIKVYLRAEAEERKKKAMEVKQSPRRKYFSKTWRTNRRAYMRKRDA